MESDDESIAEYVMANGGDVYSGDSSDTDLTGIDFSNSNIPLATIEYCSGPVYHGEEVSETSNIFTPQTFGSNRWLIDPVMPFGCVGIAASRELHGGIDAVIRHSIVEYSCTEADVQWTVQEFGRAIKAGFGAKGV
ncbi:hypothetical protein LTR36_005642 [Oleoguttula mirabilis]|uniref:Uncharacterized protein n=1 Tax=Oleoguttula mirabilis TaxID=1507867 RepID=A0AAV9JDC8_9PEZI|nr:hypothetical protein LTR36_005642 [Oleoguttula mirabilis]